MRSGWVADPQTIRDFGECIENESGRLTHLINNILDFSSIESGRKQYHVEESKLAEVVADALKTLEPQLRQGAITVKFDEPDDSLPNALVDREAITQATINLIDNAIKYSDKGRGVGVIIGRKDGYLTLSVTDQGVGIAREERERIFEKFYRVSTGLVHNVKGSGLGLSIVRSIVEDHRGFISVESEPGRGSAFTIHLPVVESAHPDRNDKR